MKHKIIVIASVMLLLVAGTVYARGLIVLSQTELQLAAKIDSTVVSKVGIINATTFDQDYRVTSNADWVKPDHAEGKLLVKQPAELKLTCSTKGMEPGMHVAQVYVNEVTDDPSGGASATLNVSMKVYESDPRLEFVPRSAYLGLGQILTIMVLNPSEIDLNVEVVPKDPWLFVYPNALEIPSRSMRVLLVRTSPTAIMAGSFPTSISIKGSGIEANYPVVVNVESGLTFNPGEIITKEGQIVVTNNLKRKVVIEASQAIGLEIDSKPFVLQPKAKKIYNFKLLENHPSEITFMFRGALADTQNIPIKK
ncbi:MAG: hypothetical protein GX421_02515 [Caldisericales bacterium]|nr:hypothetical protein [Caldisericales bacterium]